MKYNKLIRDKIPAIIKSKDSTPITHIADDEEYWQKLKEKLLEEVKEFIDSETEEELADILEVLYAIFDFKKTDRIKLEAMRITKANKRGAFKKKIILDETK